ncbi:MAG: DUF4352 domain-containing protein [Propionibacteriaceae bacterium]|jgi:hypothetical protein|nr:DUF4352 domain-containing protein [Propionibacteriaceae bacterium]
MKKFPLSSVAVLFVALALALSGCVPDGSQAQATAGKPSFTRDLGGFAPDSPDWIFVSVELNYVEGDRASNSLSPTQYRLAPTDDPEGGWLPDVAAMESLSQNSAYFASSETSAGTVTLVYQAPAERLVGAMLVSNLREEESGKPARQFDLGITEVPVVSGESGATPMDRVPMGETAELGELSVEVEQVRTAELIANMAPQYGSRFAVVDLKVTWNGAEEWSPYELRNAVRLVATPGKPTNPNMLASRMLADDNPFLSTDTLRAGDSRTGSLVFELQDESDPYLSITAKSSEYLRRFDLGWAAVQDAKRLNPDPKLAAFGTAVSADPLKVTVLKQAQTKDGAVRVQVKVTNTAESPVWPEVYFLLLDGDHKVIGAKADDSLAALLDSKKSATGWLSFAGGKANGSALLLWNESARELARLAATSSQ